MVESHICGIKQKEEPNCVWMEVKIDVDRGEHDENSIARK